MLRYEVGVAVGVRGLVELELEAAIGPDRDERGQRRYGLGVERQIEQDRPEPDPRALRVSFRILRAGGGGRAVESKLAEDELDLIENDLV